MRSWIFGSLLLVALIASPAPAQNVPPFFGGGVVAYDPEVGVVQSGALLDAQAVVSHDRKYVTLNMRADNSRLRALVPFPVVTPETAQGFVGGTVFPGDTATDAPSPQPSRRSTPRRETLPQVPDHASPDKIARSAKSWVFAREGMYLVKPLK